MAAYTVEVGRLRDRPYFVAVSVRPSLDRVEEFAAVLFYKVPETEEHVQIARIDTAHGYTHLDRLYAEEQDAVAFEGDVWDAQAHLEANWERYARLHRENHEE